MCPRGVPKAGFRNRKKIASAVTQAIFATHTPVIETTETDEEIDIKLRKRFKVLGEMTKAAIGGVIRAMIVSGPPGLSKSYTVERVLNDADPSGKRTVIVKGFVRATGLFKLLYDYRHANNVIVFDDCDSVFLDQDAINLLKGACDTTDKRTLTWGAETRMVDEDGESLPRSFEFQGSVIFITNMCFDTMIANGGRNSEHLSAMISRSHYIDTGMKSQRDYLIRIRQVVEDEGMLANRGFRPNEVREIIDFIFDNAGRLRDLSLRAVIKLADLYRAGPNWKDTAEVTMFKAR
jgi:hypothetical protein